MIALRKPTRFGGFRGVNIAVRQDGSEIHLDDIESAAEGQAIFDENDAAILRIESQLDGPHDTRDGEWEKRARHALRMKRRIRQTLQMRIGELRRAERDAALDRAFEPGDAQRKAFMAAVEELLPHETVTELWARAQELRPAAFEDRGGRP